MNRMELKRMIVGTDLEKALGFCNSRDKEEGCGARDRITECIEAVVERCLIFEDQSTTPALAIERSESIILRTGLERLLKNLEDYTYSPCKYTYKYNLAEVGFSLITLQCEFLY